jgi:hypothetical protein
MSILLLSKFGRSEPDQGLSSTRRKNHLALSHTWLAWLVVILIVYVVVLLLVRPLDYVDTFNYAKHIVDRHNHAFPAHTDPFWDFGHLLWRPMGYVVWDLLHGWLRNLFQGDDVLGAGAVLIGLNIVIGGAGAIFLFFLARMTTGNNLVAAIIALAYVCSNAFLYYSLTGMAYGAGLTFQIAAIYYIERALKRGQFHLTEGIEAGLLLGLSVLIWFPYVLSVAGIFCYALLSTGAGQRLGFRQRVPGSVALVAAAAVITLLAYAIVIAVCHFTTVQAASEWISRSRYGKLPTRGLLRLVGSVPRGFVALGEGNTQLKRILFENGSLSYVQAVRSLWKTALV